jgi:hypothetical protein
VNFETRFRGVFLFLGMRGMKFPCIDGRRMQNGKQASWFSSRILLMWPLLYLLPLKRLMAA